MKQEITKPFGFEFLKIHGIFMASKIPKTTKEFLCSKIMKYRVSRDFAK
ncbi:hypothetical protein J4221_05815 [Candidatus Pacearchaeota archaeon]|nr:hypothetical protein [Candidatus Pacearchaeota archaeon]